MDKSKFQQHILVADKNWSRKRLEQTAAQSRIQQPGQLSTDQNIEVAKGDATIDEIRQRAEETKVMSDEEVNRTIKEMPASVLSAQTEDEIVVALIEAEVGADAPQEEKDVVKQRYKNWRDGVIALGGVWIQNRYEESDFGTFLSNFMFGRDSYGGSLSSSSGRFGKETSEAVITDYQLWDRMKLGTNYVVEAIKTAFGSEGMNVNVSYLDLDKAKDDREHLEFILREFVKVVKESSENWQDASLGLAYFYEPGKSGFACDEKVKLLFEDMANNLNKYYPATK